MGVLTVGRLEAGKGAAGISRILVLHTGLVHHNRVARRIERETVENGVEGRGAVLRKGSRSSKSAGEESKEHSKSPRDSLDGRPAGGLTVRKAAECPRFNRGNE